MSKKSHSKNGIVIIKKIFDKFNLRNRSELFQRSLKNAGWSVADYIVIPILMLVSTPFLVHKLGVAQYGIWMLVNSIMGMMGAMNLGLGDATIKFVSHYRAKNDVPAVVRVINSTLTIYAAFGIIIAGVVYILAPVLVHRVFKVDSGLHSLAIQAMQAGGAVLAIKFIESVFLATLQGFERYDLSARVTIVIKVFIITFSVLLAALGYGLVQIIFSTMVFTSLSAAAQAQVAKRLVKGLHYKPIVNIAVLKEVFSFGLWSWLQGVAGTFFSQVDRFLISIILGTSALTYYTVCLQIAQQVHSLLASASSFIFPMSSAFHGSGSIETLHTIYSKAMTVITTLAISIVIPLYMLSFTILTVWMGYDFAEQGNKIFRLLILAYGGLALTIVPYYLLNGTGFIRINVLFGLISGVIVTAVAMILIPKIGIAGAGWAQLTNFITVALYSIYINRIVFKDKSWISISSYLAPYLIPIIFLIAISGIVDFTGKGLHSFYLIILPSFLSAFGAIISYRISKMRRSVYK